MAAGLPVITSDAVPFARIVRETGTGVVFQSGDPRSLAAAIRALADPALRRRYGSAGLGAVRTRYHWEYDAGVLVEAVGEVTDASSRRVLTAAPAEASR
jgi:glycosyltransferase involved in cell wall biosynthesis